MSFSLYISYITLLFKFGLLLVSRTPILGLEVPCTIHCTKRRNYGGSGRIRTTDIRRWRIYSPLHQTNYATYPLGAECRFELQVLVYETNVLPLHYSAIYLEGDTRNRTQNSSLSVNANKLLLVIISNHIFCLVLYH